MELNNQVIPLELAKKLKELGVPQNGYSDWVIYRPGAIPCVWNATDWSEFEVGGEERLGSAFTAEELATMSGVGRIERAKNKMWCVTDIEGRICLGYTLAEALAELLIRRIEEGSVDPKTL